MGDNSEPLADQAAQEVAIISHHGLLIKMGAVIAAGSIAGFALFSTRAGVGVLVGGALAYANYYWHRHSLKAIFDRAVEGRRTRFLAVRYILRYAVLGAALTAIYLTETVSIFAVIFGLASFALAVMIEGFASLFSTDKQEV